MLAFSRTLLLAPNMGKQLMVAPNVGQAACCFFSTSRIASSEISVHQADPADVKAANQEAIKSSMMKSYMKYKVDNETALKAIKKMKMEEYYTLKRDAWDNLVFLRPVEDEQQKLLIKGWIMFANVHAKLHDRPALVAKHQWLEARGKYALGETDIVEVAKVTKDTTMTFIADPGIAKMAKEQGAVVPTFDEQKVALEKATTPEEVLSICQEIHDGMEYFLMRFKANSGYSSDDIAALRRMNAIGSALEDPKEPIHNPIKKWRLNRRYSAAVKGWAKRTAVRHGYGWTGFGDGGRADWIRFYLVMGLASILLMKASMFFYWNMMKGRGKDKWI